MKKLLKRVLLYILTLSLITGINFKQNTVQAFKNDDIKPMAWPGRPGNENGIGVETNTYSCNTDWKYVGSKNGKVETLRKYNESIVNGNLSLLTSIILFPFKPYISTLAGLAAGSLYTSNIKGDVYTAYTYSSSNCFKVVYHLRYYNGSSAGRIEKYAKK